MVNFFIIFFSLLSYCGNVCAAENASDIQDIVLELRFSVMTTRALIYSGQKNRDSCKRIGIASKDNEPFCRTFHGPYTSTKFNDEYKEANPFCTSLPPEELDIILNAFKQITEVPYSSLLNTDKSGLKEGKEEVSSSTVIIKNNKYRVKVIMPECSQKGVQVRNLLENFEEQVNYYFDDKNKLLQKGIIAQDGDKIIHGPYGFLAPPRITLQLACKDVYESLKYVGIQYLNSCKKFGMESDLPDPFCSDVCKHDNLDAKSLENLHEKDCDDFKFCYNNIDGVPFKYIVEQGDLQDFHNGKSCTVQGLKFKKENAIISSSVIKINGNEYTVVLTMPNISWQITAEEMLKDFRQTPSYFEIEEDELIKLGIIKKYGDKIIHGPYGYEQNVILFYLKEHHTWGIGLTAIMAVYLLYLYCKFR